MNIDKNTIIKAVSILVALFICVFGLTQILEHNSQTLTDYAAENPAPPKPVESESTQEPTVESEENAGETGESDSELPPQSSLTGALLNGASMADARITYEESFYYEPLSENLKRYITGVSFPTETEPAITYDELRYVHILHYDFDGNLAEGELICNEYIAQDLVEIFYELYRNEYQLESVLLIDEFDGDDTASMEANNTSCFNYRVVEGSTSLSKHALGLALDINPLYNPYITYNDDGSENVSPEGGAAYADRSVSFPYKIDENDLCHKLFIEHGFIWGGNWNSCKDYQHFQKVKE